MVTVVVYDISNDKERKSAEDICLDHGLQRIQHSVFRGRPDAAQVQALVVAFTAEAREEHEGGWDVHAYFIAEDDFKRHCRFTPEGQVADSAAEPEILVC
jgi:CRISPR-associated endonuclease Cas2